MLEQIRAIRNTAIRSKDKEVLTSAREVLSEVDNFRIEFKREPNDEDMIEIVNRQLKMTKESIDEIEKSKSISENTATRLEMLKRRVELYTEWLPAKLNEDEIRDIVTKIINDNNFTRKDMKDFRQLLNPLVKGKADGKLVTAVVDQYLK
ncbi:GatB/YqeY domain-containing protein [Paenibacillus pabuli]|uniref:GatB/YqeY domain-containing protein n=1 Tax=Paenibacillus pabuli TaxID=1472 RepID=UPI003242E818